MLDNLRYLECSYGKIPMAFTLNVMEAIQEEYNDFETWMNLLKNKMPSIKALKFFVTATINEGIGIENSKLGKRRDFIDSADAGRIVTECGMVKTIQEINKLISGSLPQLGLIQDDGKNEVSPQNQ